MTGQLIQSFMIRQTDITILTLRYPSTRTAFYHRSKSSAVLEKYNLLLLFKCLTDFLKQEWRKLSRHPLLSGKFLDIYHLNMRKQNILMSFGKLYPAIFSMNSIIIGFDTRCSRTQQCLCSEHRCQYDSCIARMITWSRILLFIGIFMFFIHDDQSQTPERQKNRRTYSKYYIIIVIGKLFTPYLYTFSIRKLGVINSQPITKYPFQTFGDLCSQCYLRQQIQHLLSCLNCLLNKMNIDFSLSACSNTMKQADIFLMKVRQDLAIRLLLGTA